MQKLIRSIPKPVIAAVAGWAIGGGHVLHVVCDLTIAAENAKFGQTGPKVGSFDGGFGASYLARIVGQKKAREIWYLCDQYDAEDADKMGLVNKVVPLEKLEEAYVEWAKKMESLGSGEILLTSMDRDGTKDGYDIELTKTVSRAVNIPVIASGGVGTIEHIYDGFINGEADAALAASIFHYRENSVKEVKEYLQERHIPVRLTD